MAKKKPVAVPKPVDPEMQAAQRGKEFYKTVVDSLMSLTPATYPVKFLDERYHHLNGNRETKEGVFVRMLDLHEQDGIRDESRHKGLKANSPAMVLNLALKSACTFNGEPMFDTDNPLHQELLVKESTFTSDIWIEAMYVNGYYTRPETDVAKNSEETTNSDSESD